MKRLTEFRYFLRKGALKPKVGVAGEAPVLQYRYYMGTANTAEPEDPYFAEIWSEWENVPRDISIVEEE